MFKKGKLFSVISVVVAGIILSSAVFADDRVSKSDNFTVEIFNSGEQMDLINQPFAKDGTVYIPLREFMQKLGMNDEKGIVWNNGKITLYLEGHSDYYVMEIDKKHIQYDSLEHLPNSLAIMEVENSPLLADDLTYIPYEYINFIFNRFGDKHLIDYEIYDGDNDKVGFSVTANMLFDKKFSVEIPTSWTEKVECVVECVYGAEADNISYVQKSSLTKYNAGTLFSVKKVESSFAGELLNMLEGSKLIYDDGKFAYLFAVPTDVQKPIWDGADEEDAEIVKEYDKMYADVYKIAESIKPVNAEVLSFTEMELLQNEVDNGHYPWRLNPSDVILEFVNKNKLSGGEIQNLSKDITVSAEYKYGEDIYRIELYQSIKVNEDGAWVVKNFDKIK